MSLKSRTSCRSCASGLTLIEAVAGMALLGTLLVGMLVAAGQIRAQSVRSAERMRACQVADELLAGWWQDRDGLPRQSEGAVAGNPGWLWKTMPVRNGQAERLGGEVVALEIIGDRDGPPLLRIELLLAAGTRGGR